MPESWAVHLCDGRFPLPALAPTRGHPTDLPSVFPGRTMAHSFSVFHKFRKSMSSQGVLHEHPHLLDCLGALDRGRPKRYEYPRPGPRQRSGSMR